MMNISETVKRKRSFQNIVTENKSYFLSVIAILALFIIGVNINPGFMSTMNLNNIFTLSGILALAVIGQSFVMISGGNGIDMTIGPLMSMGALLGASITNGQNNMLPIAILAMAGLGALIGFINAVGIRKLRIPAMAMTLVMATVVNGLTVFLTKGIPSANVPSILMNIAMPVWSGGFISWMVVVAVAVLVIVELILRKSRFGISLYMTGSNYRAACLSGIKTNRVIFMAYIFSGVISALAGMCFVGYLGFGQMGLGESYTMLSVAAAVIGGVSVAGGEGNLIGGSLGSIVLILLTTILTVTNLNSGARDFIQGLILVGILVIDSRAPKIRQ